MKYLKETETIFHDNDKLFGPTLLSLIILKICLVKPS